MPTLALVLVLLAAVLHATWNLAAKHAGGDNRFVLLTASMVAVLWLPVGLWAGWDAVPRWGWLEWGLVLASGLVHLGYFTVLLRGYRASDLSVVYPVARGSGPLMAAAGAVLVLGEQLSLLALVGVLAVTGGVFVIAGGPALWRQARDPAQQRRVRLGLGYGMLTGLFIAAYTVIDGYAVKVALISPLLVDYFSNLLRIPFLAPLAWRQRATIWPVWRRLWRHALVVAVLSPAAYVLVLYAVTMAPLSHVAPAREVSMLVAALLGGRLLGERDLGLRLAGAALITCGVVALAW